MKTTFSKLLFATMLTAAAIGVASIGHAQTTKELQAEVAKWKKEAQDWQERAQAAERQAVQNAEAARRAERAANKARYLASAKAMAVKSRELHNDPEQEALVAMQAYRFNDEYDGNPYDNDIYNGLHTALKRFNDPVTLALQGHDKPGARALVINPVSGEFFSGGSDGRIVRWTKVDNKWKSVSLVDKRADFQVNALALSPDGKKLLAGGISKTPKKNYIELYELDSPGKAAMKIYDFPATKAVLFSRRGDGAYVLAEDGKSLKFTDFQEARELLKQGEVINAISMSTDGSKLAGAGASGELYVWDLTNNFTAKTIHKNTSDITAIFFAPDNRSIVFGEKGGLVKVVTEDSNIPPRVLTGHLAHIEQIVFNNSSTFLATTSRDHTVRIWNWKKLSDPPIVLRDQDGWVWSAAFSPDDEQLMVGVNSNTSKETIHVWPTKTTTMANSLCGYVKRNLTKEEWDNFVGSDLMYEITCQSWPANNR